MKIEGQYNNGYGAVTVDGEVLDPKPSQDVFNHSPDGFAWGYYGSGPAQLALAILLKAGVESRVAQVLHQRFKTEFIGPLNPSASFSIDVDVNEWVERHHRLAATSSEATES